MCRLLIYKGTDAMLLSEIITSPTHSILRQSFDSRLRLDTRRGQNNADGFGLGWYTTLGPKPCLYTSTLPAWNCANLERLAASTQSNLLFAHVRATTEGSLSEDNCHPFTHGALLWMHNGGIGAWKLVQRRLGRIVADRWYLGVKGSTDSEWAFALFLHILESMGHDPSRTGGFGPAVLRQALLRTIATINELIDSIPAEEIAAAGADSRSLLNFAVTDGHSVLCTRYISSRTDEAASLYYSCGSQWVERSGNYHMERRDKGADVVLIASEPITFERENWVNVPTNSVLTVHKQTVMVHPIEDSFSTRADMTAARSADYVRTKGLEGNTGFSAPVAAQV